MYIKSVGFQLMRDNNNTKKSDSQEVFVSFFNFFKFNGEKMIFSNASIFVYRLIIGCIIKEYDFDFFSLFLN